MSKETLAVLVALFFTICSNTAFFRVVHETGALDGGRGALLGLALFAAISALNTLLLLVLMTRHSTKPILTVLLVVTSLAAHFTIERGVRQIFEIAVESVQTSCGWAVPFMTFDRERDTLRKFYANESAAERMAKYAVRDRSIDGLPVRSPTVLPYR